MSIRVEEISSCIEISSDSERLILIVESSVLMQQIISSLVDK
jgi:hypothetical protein